MASTGKKNPLAVALGMVFKRTRNIMSRTSEEVAYSIGIKPSFYRLVESGTNHMHISKALNVVDAFEGRLTFDGVAKILTCISIMEVYGRNSEDYYSGLEEAVEKLVAYDDRRMKLLFQDWDSSFFHLLKNDYSHLDDWIKEKEFNAFLKRFLENYESIGKTLLESENEYSSSYLSDVPTIYLRMLDNLKRDLLKLPVRIGFETLSDWEEENLNDLRSLNVLILKHDSIIHKGNLERYQYKFLWNDSFQKANIFYADDVAEKKVNDLFSDILKQVLEKNGEVDKLKGFEKAMSKIVFKQVNPHFFNILKTNELMDFGSENSIWSFRLMGRKKETYVGFSAGVEPTNAKLTVGRSLNYPSTVKFNEIFEKNWQKHD